MNKVISAVVAFLMFFCVTVKAEERPIPSVSAEAYVLFCANNSQVILESNSHKRLGVASTTKIMTSLLTLERAETEDTIVEFKSEMMAEGSSMYLKEGDKLRLSSLAAGMMTVSGNDAANAAALTLSESYESFSLLMNRRAREIGMADTNFVTPSGLPDDDHFSTAYDMALLMQEAMNNESFRELTALKSVEVEFISPPGHSVTYSNHNRLLSSYPYCIGGKTGYAKSTGRCLVTCSEKDGLRLICVTLNAPDDWNDHKALYDYGFSRYSALTPALEDDLKIKVAGGESPFVLASLVDYGTLVVPTEDKEKIVGMVYTVPFTFAPVNKGDIVGKFVYYLDDEILFQTHIVAESSVSGVQINFFKRLMNRLFG